MHSHVQVIQSLQVLAAEAAVLSGGLDAAELHAHAITGNFHARLACMQTAFAYMQHRACNGLEPKEQ